MNCLNISATLAAVQLLPASEQVKVAALLESKARRNQRARFARCLEAAKAKAEQEERERDERLVRHWEEREALESMEDLPW
ncbi:MAG: hypothetical protein ABTQ25_18620 [Nitrosomonas ureae]